MSRASLTAATLAERIGARLSGDPDVVLTGATHDSRRVRPGDLFCCVPGAAADGHDFAPSAVAAGAAALLCARPLGAGVPELLVDDVRVAMAPAAAELAGHPAEQLRVVGVTGTNGKTTVVSMVAAVLDHAGRRAATIGTLTGERTTPEATDLQAALAGLLEEGVQDVALEVSSHALDLHRVDAMTFAVGVFTNLGVDHLDHHRTPEAYFAAKARLFDPGRCRAGVVNVDDVRGRLLMDASGGSLVGYSMRDVDGLECRVDGSSFRWRGQAVRLPLPGRHNVSNALAAAEACRILGVTDDVVAAGLATVPAVPGRFEAVRAGQPFAVVVDFAHTPDALEAVLEAAGEFARPGGAVTVVFGCGGDRDRSKRPAMGEVACRLADRVVVTNDNPRREDAARIIDEIRTGCPDAPVVEPDRRAAIRLALAGASPGDVVVIAGKGHEQGQIFADRTEPFDDRAVAAEELAALGHGERVP